MDYRLKYALIEQIICGFERTNTLYIDYSEVMMVPKAGFEPAWVTPHAPQTCVSTRFHHFGTYRLCYYKNLRVFKTFKRSLSGNELFVALDFYLFFKTLNICLNCLFFSVIKHLL